MHGLRIVIGLTALLLCGGVFVPRILPSSPVLATIDLGSIPTSMVIDTATGRVFVSTIANGGSIAVLDSRTSTLQHLVKLPEYPLTEELPAMPWNGYDHLVIDRQGKHLWLDREDGTEYRLDTQSGTVVHVTGLQVQASSLRIGQRLVSLITPSPYVAFVEIRDRATGRMIQRMDLGDDTRFTYLDQTRQRIFASDRATEVRIVDAYQGTVVRVVKIPVFQLDVSDHTGHLFILTSSGTLATLDARTGRLLHQVHTGMAIAPALVGPLPFDLVDEKRYRIFFPNPAGDAVLVFDTRSGDLVRICHVGPYPTAMALDRRHGYLLVTSTQDADPIGDPTGAGSMSVIDERSGRLLRTVPVGVAPSAVAVDERTNRAFVLNRNSNPNFTPARIRGRHNWWKSWNAWLHDRLPFVLGTQSSQSIVHGSVTVVDTAQL